MFQTGEQNNLGLFFLYFKSAASEGQQGGEVLMERGKNLSTRNDALNTLTPQAGSHCVTDSSFRFLAFAG